MKKFLVMCVALVAFASCDKQTQAPATTAPTSDVVSDSGKTEDVSAVDTSNTVTPVSVDPSVTPTDVPVAPDASEGK